MARKSYSILGETLLMVDVKVYYSQQEWVHTLCYWWMSKSTTVNKNGFTPSANGGCQSLLQSTSMGSHPLLMVDVKSTTVNEYGFKPFANGRCQSPLQST